MTNPTPAAKTFATGLFARSALFFCIALFPSACSQRAMELRMVDAMSDMAVARMDDASETDRSMDFIQIPIEAREIRPNIFQATGVANTNVIVTSEGNVLYDSGLSIQVPKQIKALEAVIPDTPPTHIIVSHSHADHAGGVKFWAREGTEIVAHEEFEEEQRYLEELQDYQWNHNKMLFTFMPDTPPKIGLLAYGGIKPTRVVRNGEPYHFEQGGVKFEVLATPGAEGADNIVLWLPEEKVLFTGDFFGPLYPQFPNIFTMRGEKIRKPIEYIRSLNEIIALGPELIVPAHKNPVEGADVIMDGLVKMRDAVQYVHDETVKGMNAGKSVYELMAEIQLPPHLELNQAHGRDSWGVKSIWEYYGTWFHFDRTTELYEVPPTAVYPEIAELAGVDNLVAKARTHIDADQPVHALHILEIALLPDGNNRAALQARRDALAILLERAENGLQNSYEVDWLKYRIRHTDARLSPR